jgi:hypothetical protein
MAKKTDLADVVEALDQVYGLLMHIGALTAMRILREGDLAKYSDKQKEYLTTIANWTKAGEDEEDDQVDDEGKMIDDLLNVAGDSPDLHLPDLKRN